MTDNARKTEILESATLLFSKQGYSATSVREIAERVGMEAPSLYHYFQGKEELLNEICFSLAKKFLSAMDDVNDIYFDAEKKLRMAIENHIRILTADVAKSHVFLFEWRRLNDDKLADFMKLRDRYEAGFKEILQTGENENLFQEVDKKFAALTILGTINWVVEWYKPDGDMSVKQIADKLSDFILDGLRKQKPF